MHFLNEWMFFLSLKCEQLPSRLYSCCIFLNDLGSSWKPAVYSTQLEIMCTCLDPACSGLCYRVSILHDSLVSHKVDFPGKLMEEWREGWMKGWTDGWTLRYVRSQAGRQA